MSSRNMDAELFDARACSPIESVPAKPQDETAKTAKRQIMTRECIDFCNLPDLYLWRISQYEVQALLLRSRRQYRRPYGSRRNLQNHGIQVCAKPAASPDPVSLNRIDRLQKSLRNKYSRIRNFVRSAMAPDTMVAAVAQNTKIEIQN